MAVSIKQTSDVAAVITVSVKAADYQPQVEKELKSYQKRANIPGFRPGHAPLGLIKKQVGTSIKVEEINRAVIGALFGYIEEQKLDVLGSPIPVENEPEYDFATQEDFEFSYDVALAPKIDVKLTKKDKLTYYRIEATKQMEDDQIQRMLTNAGKQVDADSVEENDVVYGRMVELEAGEPKQGGIEAEKALILPRYTTDEAQKAKLLGAKVGDTLTLEPYALYGGNEAEVATLLSIDKAAVPALAGVSFSYQIHRISRREAAELNEAFFVEAFGEASEIRTEEALRQNIRESFAEQFATESDYKFIRDLRALLIEKAGKVAYDEALLKRIFLARNKDAKVEDLDRDMPKILEDITFDRIKGQMLEAAGVKIEEEDVQKFALIVAKNQFAMYGMTSVPDEVLANYAQSMLKEDRSRENIIDRVADSKLAAIAKEKVAVTEKAVSPEEFNALMSEGANA
jgi:trigger factor|nr:trigger factor [uncultured Porphyromonas sp.]